MTKQELAGRFVNACESVKTIKDELNEIDARFGDADHGLTMSKIAAAIEGAARGAEGSVQEMLTACSDAVSEVGGGAAVPLWSSWLSGMADGAPAAKELTIEELKAVFASGFEMLDFMSGAQVGDKTMMDAVIPAQKAIEAYDGQDVQALFEAAASAAEAGAQSTKEIASKFGRAKYYGDKTIGTADAGALSMAAFFKGLAAA